MRITLIILTSVTVWISDATAASVARPLTVTDERDSRGLLTVETPEWKLVFSATYNWGIQQWYDLVADPDETDNLAGGEPNTGYSQGIVFDYDIYLGFPDGPTPESQANEFMTTIGPSFSPGAATLEILESTSARVRLRQSGHPRLNNARGPAGDLWLELALVSFETDYTIYPNGAIYIDFSTTLNPSEAVVTTGSGGTGPGIDVSGDMVTAVNGMDFVAAKIFEGDSIESVAGGFGATRIKWRISATQLQLEGPVASGTALDFTVRRDRIINETISIHSDGDPSSRVQCVDAGVPYWQGGSNSDAVWDTPFTDCMTFLGGAPTDYVIAHWALDRPAGALLAMFQPWPESNFGAFNTSGFIGVGYTQWGRSGFRAPETHHRQFLARLGSQSPSTLPQIKSVADALLFANDFITPYAEALVGTIDTDSDMVNGFVLGEGHYAVTADHGVATVLFDTAARSIGAALPYYSPAILVSGLGNISDIDVAISTDAGTTFAPIASSLLNAAEVTPGIWLVHYLGTIPATSSGANAVAIRVATADSGGSSGGCAIALAAGGTALAGQLGPLRTMRNTQLLTNAPGAAFVNAYYTLSRRIAPSVRTSPALAAGIRWLTVPATVVARMLCNAPGALSTAVDPPSAASSETDPGI